MIRKERRKIKLGILGLLIISLFLVTLFALSTNTSITGYSVIEEQWEHSLQVSASVNDSVITETITFDNYKPSNCQDGIIVRNDNNSIDYEIINSTYENNSCIEATIQFNNIIYQNITTQTLINTTNVTEPTNQTIINDTNTSEFTNQTNITEPEINDTNTTIPEESINDSNTTLPEDTNDTILDNTTLDNDTQDNTSFNNDTTEEPSDAQEDTNITEPETNDIEPQINETEENINNDTEEQEEIEDEDESSEEESNTEESETEETEEDSSEQDIEEIEDQSEQEDSEEDESESENQNPIEEEDSGGESEETEDESSNEEETAEEESEQEDSEDDESEESEEAESEESEEEAEEIEEAQEQQEEAEQEAQEDAEEDSGDSITGAIIAFLTGDTENTTTYTIYYGRIQEDVALAINYSDLKQGEVIIDEPVNWTQNISVYNPSNFTKNQEINLDLPGDISNLEIYQKNNLTSSSEILQIYLETGESNEFLVKFQTSPVRVQIEDINIELASLLPPEAQDIKVKVGERLIGNYLNLQQANLKLPGTEKKVFVYHNSSLHYYNITVEIPFSKEASFSRTVNGSKVNAENEISRDLNNLIWTVPKLSGANASVAPEIVKKQGKARVGEPVNWTMEINNYTVTYETPAPKKIEEDLGSKKKVTVVSEATDHYYNVSAFTNLPELDYKPRIKRAVNGSKLDITTLDSYNVTYLDEDGDSFYDRVEWIVPRLSNDTYEIELIILNVQSHPIVGGSWTVMFNTTGTANLTINAVNGTTWSNTSESEDLRFLKLKCGDSEVNTSWINNSVFVENYSCNNKTSYEISKVLTLGKHNLRFVFGGITKYANNWAWLTPDSVVAYSDQYGLLQPASNSIDNDTSSSWAEDPRTNKDGSTYDWNITYDLGDTYDVHGISAYLYGSSDNEVCSIRVVKVCDDSACTGESNLLDWSVTYSGSATWRNHTINSTEGRYVMLKGAIRDVELFSVCLNKDSDSEMINFYEFRVNASDLNNAPNAPTVNNPSDGATGQPLAVDLNVTVTDPDGDSMNVSFYDSKSQSPIGSTQTGISNGSTAQVTWSGLGAGTGYVWYASASDGTDTNQSETWRFTTSYTPTLVLNDTYPDSPRPINDIKFNITCTDPDSGETITGYVQLYNGSSSYGSVQSSTVTNNTETTLYTLASSNTADGETWTGEYWCGDSYSNSSASNDSVTIQNTAPDKPTLNDPSPSGTNVSTVNTILNITVTDQDGDNISVRFLNFSDDSLIGAGLGNIVEIYYQEFANESDDDSSQTDSDEDPPEDTDPSLMDYSGTYSCEDVWESSHPCNHTYDGNWSTYGESDGTEWHHMYVNYTKPKHALSSSLWKVKDIVGEENLSFSSEYIDCWNYNPNIISLRVRTYGSGSVGVFTWECLNGTTWRAMRWDSSHRKVYEEAMLWNISSASNGTAVTTTWSGLLEGSTYFWYANVTDNSDSNTSDTWNFTVTNVNPNVTTNIVTSTDPEGEYVRGEVEINASVSDSGVGLKDNSGQFAIFTGATVWSSANDDFKDGDSSGVLNYTWNTSNGSYTDGINYSYNFRVNDTVDNRGTGTALWTVVCNDLDTKGNCSALSPTACEQESYWWYDSGSGQNTCCGDDSEEYWNASDSFGCCCNGTPIANNTIDEQCEDYNNYWCIDGIYCTSGSGMVRDASLNAGDEEYILGGDDISCGCDSSGDKCDTGLSDTTATGICASTNCDTNLVALDGGTYDSSCSAGHECDSDVTPTASTPRYLRNGYCAQGTCATSLIAADTNGAECGSVTSGCTAHGFEDGDEDYQCDSSNEGAVCSTTVTSGDPPTANGACVENSCDTNEIAVNCGTNGCSSEDLTDANMYSDCSSHASESCENGAIGSDGFNQEGTCLSDNSCDDAGEVCYHSSSYYDDCDTSCDYKDTCDSDATSDGDYSADGVCGDSSHANCCTDFARNASGAATGPGSCDTEATVCGAGYEGYYCDDVSDASWDAGDSAGNNKTRCDEDNTACILCNSDNRENASTGKWNEGDGNCEAGCGAAATCDEVALGSNNGNSCCYSSCSADTEIHSGDSVTWGMCDFNSQTGSNDYCYDDSLDACYYLSGDSCDSTNGWGDSGGADFDKASCYDPGYVSSNLCYYDGNDGSVDESNSCSSTGCTGISSQDWTVIVGSCDYGLWSDALVNCSVNSTDICYHSTDGCVDSGADGADGWDYIQLNCDDYDVDGSGNIINESEINSTSCTSTCSGNSCCEIQTVTCEAAQECNMSYDLLTNENDTSNQTCFRNNSGSWIWNSSAHSNETACSDGYDNDCDGLIDRYDTDCNGAPDKPTLVYPGLGAYVNTTSPLLNVTVIDPDGDSLNITFYNNDTSSSICNQTNISNGSWANCSWSGLSHGLTYYWYVNASDGPFETKSDVWNFTVDTANPVAEFGDNPVDNYKDSDGTIDFEMKCSDSLSGPDSIVLYGNWSGSWQVEATNSSPVNNTIWTYQETSISEGHWGWYVWCNDSAGNSDVTDTNRSFTVDTTPPQWSDVNYINLNCSEAGNPFGCSGNISIYKDHTINFNSTWNDSSVGLDSWWFSWNDTGSWENISSGSFSGIGVNNYSSTNETVTASSGTSVHWKFCANDTAGNSNCTAIQNFSVSSKSVGMTLSSNLSSSILWNITNLSSSARINISALGNNNTGNSFYYIDIITTGCKANLYINGTDLQNTTTIGISNESVRYGNSDPTLEGTYASTTLSNSLVSIGSALANGITQYLKFYITIPSQQAVGKYTNNIDIKVNKTSGT